MKGNTSLTPTQKFLINQFLAKRKICIYIDDLDRGWEGRKEDISQISALLNAVRDISRDNNGIFFRISLRSDVYFLVRTSDESTDKIEGSVVWHTWTNHEILIILVKRIESFFGRKIDEPDLLSSSQQQLANHLHSVFEPRFSGEGHWENAPMHRVLMSLIRRRPRDLVKLCTLAAKKACNLKGGALIRTNNLKDSFEEYSGGRLKDTILEYRSELPGIERLLMGMKPNRKEKTTKEGYSYKSDGLLKKIKNIQESGEFKFSNGNVATPSQLAGFMYKINFITARKENLEGEIIRKYFEESQYLQNSFGDFGFDWEIQSLS